MLASRRNHTRRCNRGSYAETLRVETGRGKVRTDNEAKRDSLELMLPVRADSARKRYFVGLLGFFSLVPFAIAGQGNSGNSATNPATSSGAWSGTLVSSSCNADEAFNESSECMKNVPGAKLTLYDDTNRVMYGLEPQAGVTAHLGDSVTVRGTLDGDTIRIASVQPVSIGLAAGQKAPAFSVHDQFGRVQTLDTLKGKNGTVLLFFRSADW